MQVPCFCRHRCWEHSVSWRYCTPSSEYSRLVPPSATIDIQYIAFHLPFFQTPSVPNFVEDSVNHLTLVVFRFLLTYVLWKLATRRSSSLVSLLDSSCCITADIIRTNSFDLSLQPEGSSKSMINIWRIPVLVEWGADTSASVISSMKAFNQFH